MRVLVRACICRICKLHLRELMLVPGSALHICMETCMSHRTLMFSATVSCVQCLYEARVCGCVCVCVSSGCSVTIKIKATTTNSTQFDLDFTPQFCAAHYHDYFTFRMIPDRFVCFCWH